MAGNRIQFLFAMAFVFGCNQTPPQGVVAAPMPATYIVRHHEGPVKVYDGARRIIFVNGQGGHYTAGQNEDSRTNVSSIASSAVDMPPYSKGAAAWQTFLTCIQDEFSRFNVEVTDQDPGNVPHLEAVISGTPDMIGLGQGVGGIANMNDDCSLFENGITWIFEQVFNSAQIDCEVAAQEISHNIGLDHEYLCQDPMTYLDGCGHKTFHDQDVSCGEYSPRQCMCADPRNGSAAHQNSVQFLLLRLGAAGSGTGGAGGGSGGAGGSGGSGGAGGSGGSGGGDMIPPAVAITEPAAGATVPLQFDIKVDASDNSGMVARVEFLADGMSLGSITAQPWIFTVPANRLHAGPHVLSAKAYDPSNNSATSQVVNVTVMDQSGGSGGSGGGNPPGASGDVNGGCATIPGAAGGGSALLLVALALLIRRKR